MRSPLGLLLVLVMVVPVWGQDLGAGRPAPEFALTDLLGETHRLSDYRGQAVFLNFWATWCPPCLDEMPALERVYRALKGRGLVVVAVSLDTGPRSAVERFVKELALTFPILLDPRGASVRAYRLPGLPVSFLIDRKGRLVAQELGARDWNAGEARARIEALVQ
jgi:peroxiredoxin